jgi:phage terminase Nu1 subunit (DNA packaging protein)
MALTNAKMLGGVFELTESRIHQLVKLGMPKQARSKFDLMQCIRWYIRYLQKKVEQKAIDGGDGNPQGANDQRIRGMKADADLKEMDLALRKGQLVKIEDVRAVWAEITLMAKARILSVPPRLAGEVMGQNSRVMIQALMEKALKDALNQLADEGANYQPKK